jgi:hypothetical protein
MRWRGFITSVPSLVERALVPADETVDPVSYMSDCDIGSPIFSRRTTRARRAARALLHQVEEAEAVFVLARVVQGLAQCAQTILTAHEPALPQDRGEVRLNVPAADEGIPRHSQRVFKGPRR